MAAVQVRLVSSAGLPAKLRHPRGSNNPSDYTIGLPIGFGASSIVYSATYHPSDGAPPVPCALKVLNLDKLSPAALRLLTRETQLMSLSKVCARTSRPGSEFTLKASFPVAYFGSWLS